MSEQRPDYIAHDSIIDANIVCEACGHDFPPKRMASIPTEVNLRDGRIKNLVLCKNCDADMWDESVPGDWIKLASGEVVQRPGWACDICMGVYGYDMVALLVDMDDYILDHDVDSDNPHPKAENDPAMYIVCDFCVKREPERFQPKQ